MRSETVWCSMYDEWWVMGYKVWNRTVRYEAVRNRRMAVWCGMMEHNIVSWIQQFVRGDYCIVSWIQQFVRGDNALSRGSNMLPGGANTSSTSGSSILCRGFSILSRGSIVSRCGFNILLRDSRGSRILSRGENNPSLISTSCLAVTTFYPVVPTFCPVVTTSCLLVSIVYPVAPTFSLQWRDSSIHCVPWL